MGKLVSDRFLGNVLSVVAEVREPPAALEARVYAAIDDTCSNRALRRRKPWRAVRFVLDAPPALLAAFASLLFIVAPLLIVRFSIASPRGLTVKSMEEASSSEEKSLSLGSVLKGRETLRTGEKGHITVSMNDAIILHVFEKSEVRLQESKKSLGIRLVSGALYVSRRRSSSEREPLVFIFDQTVSLLGTTLYVEKTGNDTYRLICREGILEVHAGGKPEKKLVRIEAGEYVDVSASGRILEQGRMESLPGKYSAMFDALMALNSRIEGASATPPYRVEPETQPQAVAPQAEKPKYEIRMLSRLDSFAPETAQRCFAKPFSMKKESYVELYDGIYRLTPKRLIKVLSFTRTPAAPPLMVSGNLLLFFQDGIAIYSEGFEKRTELPFPGKGSLQNGYDPVFWDGSVLLPLQGLGLYRYLPETEAFEAVHDSVFPSTPIVLGKDVIVGTYYRNSYARMDANRKTVWEYPLPGRSYVNPLAVGEDEYLYCEDGAGQKIIRLGDSGKVLREMPLAEPVLSDMAAYADQLFLVSAKGNLFKLDLGSGRSELVKRLYDEALTNGEWRNLSITVDANRLIALTSKGELEIFALPGMASLLKARISSDAPFKMQPVAEGNRVYAINDAGAVFVMDIFED